MSETTDKKPESNEQLLNRAYQQTERAYAIVNKATSRRQFKGPEIWEFLGYLRGATAAAQEMENRSRGNAPAQVGD